MKNISTGIHHHTSLDGLCRYAEVLKYGDVHMKFDHALSLRAIVAIHNLTRGPAIGGCRLVPYASTDAALEDALRLGFMMSYKAAINNLPHGGAKSVIMMPKEIKNREVFFEKFGDFINDLGGRYIVAVDSGTTPKDMDIIARRTPFVSCTTNSGSDGDPSPQTAFGVYRAIQAAVKFKLNKDDLDGVRVAIQGVGHVGYYLAQHLRSAGAKLTVCDINKDSLTRAVKEFGAEVVDPENIYDVDADIFSPCALGSILNLQHIKRLKTKIVAGSANNQLAHYQYGAALHERGILYAPDFLINAGGLIQVSVIYDHGDKQQAHEQISNIYYTVMDIFEKSARENRATNDIAEAIATEKLHLQPATALS
jgi:leucine dehydrogenase